MNIGIYLQPSASKWNEIISTRSAEVTSKRGMFPKSLVMIPLLILLHSQHNSCVLTDDLCRHCWCLRNYSLSITLCLADTVGQVLAVHIQGEAAPVLTLLQPRPPLCQPPLGAVLQLRAVAGHPLLLPARQVACNKQFYCGNACCKQTFKGRPFSISTLPIFCICRNLDAKTPFLLCKFKRILFLNMTTSTSWGTTMSRVQTWSHSVPSLLCKMK